MTTKPIDVRNLVADFALRVRQQEPVIFGPNVDETNVPELKQDQFTAFERFVAFNRKSDRLYGFNFPTVRYILRTPYARFMRPVVKALLISSDLMRGIDGRQRTLAADVETLRLEVATLRSRIVQLEQGEAESAKGLDAQPPGLGFNEQVVTPGSGSDPDHYCRSR